MSVFVRALLLFVIALTIAVAHRAQGAVGQAKSANTNRAATSETEPQDDEAASADNEVEEPSEKPAQVKPAVVAPKVKKVAAAVQPTATPSAISPQTTARLAAAQIAAKSAAEKSTAVNKTVGTSPSVSTASSQTAAVRKAKQAKVAEANASTTHPANAVNGSAAAPLAQPRKVASAKKPATPANVSRTSIVTETLPAPATATPTQTVAETITSESQYGIPDQSRMLNPAYHPARVKRYGGGWYLAGAKPAGGGGPMTEMVPTPEPVYDNGGAPVDGGYVDGDPSMDGGYVDGGGMGEGIGGFGAGLGGSGLGGGGGGATTGGAIPNFSNGRRYAFVGGADMMWIRPRFSESTGMVKTDFSQSGANTQFFQTTYPFGGSYQGGFRTYIGMRDVCCGDEWRLTFFNLEAADRMHGVATNTTSFCDFLCNETPNPGDSVTTNWRMGASIWDLDCIRPFFFNPQCCNSCCGPNCPVWDLRWFAGLRAAYINHYINAVVTDANNTVDGLLTDAHAAFKFTGVGPRVGMQGRKYFGQTGRLSLYGRGSGSLLVGTASEEVRNTAHGGEGLGLTTNTLFSRNNRMIPVAEVELGATIWVIPQFAVSAGWNLQCFWDLGMQETGSATTPTFDDSNILGLDSIFVRGEFVF